MANMSFKKKLLIGLVIFVVIAAIGKMTGKYSKDSKKAIAKSSTQLTPAQRDSITKAERITMIEKRKQSTISASDLLSTYMENEISADNNYKGKKFYVEGYIENIGKDILDNIYVSLRSSEAIRSVQCYIDDPEAVSQLQKGEKITVFGKCNGLMVNVMIKNAKLVTNIEDL